LVLVAVLASVLFGCTDGRSNGSATGRPATGGSGAPAGPRCVPDPSPDRSGDLPDLTLRCLRPGADVRLAALSGPAVINLWASWCAPCRTELPAFQRYAERAGDRVRVIGVDSDDTTDAGQALVDDLHLTFPMLYDDRGSLRQARGRAGLPVTLFVDTQGRIVRDYNGQALDDTTLPKLVEETLGVSL
jgi:thiol-disulfide isomerase/thioredoxin